MALAWPVVKEVVQLRERLNSLVDELGGAGSASVSATAGSSDRVAADLYEADCEVVLVVDAPGLDSASIELKRVGDRLRVSGFIPADSCGADEGWLRVERANGHFCREFQLPVRRFTREPTAALESGVLVVRLPVERGAPPGDGVVVEERP